MQVEQFFIVGGTSQTGHRLIEEILSRKPKAKILATSRIVQNSLPAGDLAFTLGEDVKRWGDAVQWLGLDLDVKTSFTDQLENVSDFLDKSKPLCLILSAAFTNVDGCETDSEKCTRFNVTNTLATIDWIFKKFKKTKLVFFSSDYVFDGTQGPYAEDIEYSPLANYARSKVDVEKAIQKNLKEYLIIRTTGVFDYLKGSKNFLMQMLILWGDKKKTKIPKDQFSNPVWAKDLAFGIIELVEKNHNGIFNVAGGEQLARDAFAKKIAQTFELSSEFIEPVLTADLNQKAKRPLKGGLTLDKLHKAIGWKPHTATEALKILKQKGT